MAVSYQLTTDAVEGVAFMKATPSFRFFKLTAKS